jgi:Flp pilus assembly protein TadG
MRNLLIQARRLASDKRGLASIEFCMVSGALIYGLLNGLEVARWSMQRMQVANAVHSATQAVWKACDTKQLPAKTKCAGLLPAINAGLGSTSLAGVQLTANYPTEAYYCINGSGVLTQVGTIASTKPADCSAVGDSTRSPGDYVMVSASYTYKPMMNKLTVGRFLPSSFTYTGSMRLQ